MLLRCILAIRRRDHKPTQAIHIHPIALQVATPPSPLHNPAQPMAPHDGPNIVCSHGTHVSSPTLTTKAPLTFASRTYTTTADATMIRAICCAKARSTASQPDVKARKKASGTNSRFSISLRLSSSAQHSDTCEAHVVFITGEASVRAIDPYLHLCPAKQYVACKQPSHIPRTQHTRSPPAAPSSRYQSREYPHFPAPAQSSPSTA